MGPGTAHRDELRVVRRGHGPTAGSCRRTYRRSGRRTLPVPQTQAGRWPRLKGKLDSAAPAPLRAARSASLRRSRLRDVSTATARDGDRGTPRGTEGTRGRWLGAEQPRGKGSEVALLGDGRVPTLGIPGGDGRGNASPEERGRWGLPSGLMWRWAGTSPPGGEGPGESPPGRHGGEMERGSTPTHLGESNRSPPAERGWGSPPALLREGGQWMPPVRGLVGAPGVFVGGEVGKPSSRAEGLEDRGAPELGCPPCRRAREKPRRCASASPPRAGAPGGTGGLCRRRSASCCPRGCDPRTTLIDRHPHAQQEHLPLLVQLCPTPPPGCCSCCWGSSCCTSPCWCSSSSPPSSA